MKCSTQPLTLLFLKFYGQLEEKYFAFCCNYLVVTVHNSHPCNPHFFQPCCAVVSLSVSSAFPSISCYFKWFFLPCITCTLVSLWLRNHSYTHAFLLVFDKLIMVRFALLTWQEQYEQKLLRLFFSLFSISDVNMNKCQHYITATTHLVHQTATLNWWMISCWQAKGYYHRFRAKRNATALHNRCLFKYWQNHPQRWGENAITVLSWPTT